LGLFCLWIAHICGLPLTVVAPFAVVDFAVGIAAFTPLPFPGLHYTHTHTQLHTVALCPHPSCLVIPHTLDLDWLRWLQLVVMVAVPLLVHIHYTFKLIYTCYLVAFGFEFGAVTRWICWCVGCYLPWLVPTHLTPHLDSHTHIPHTWLDPSLDIPSLLDSLALVGLVGSHTGHTHTLGFLWFQLGWLQLPILLGWIVPLFVPGCCWLVLRLLDLVTFGCCPFPLLRTLRLRCYVALPLRCPLPRCLTLIWIALRCVLAGLPRFPRVVVCCVEFAIVPLNRWTHVVGLPLRCYVAGYVGTPVTLRCVTLLWLHTHTHSLGLPPWFLVWFIHTLPHGCPFTHIWITLWIG